MSNNKPVQLGLCCLNSRLRDKRPAIFSSRKMIIRTIEEQGIDVLKEKILQNLRDTITMIEWNEKNGIKVLRLSSEMFPHKSNPKVMDYDFDFAKDLADEYYIINRGRVVKSGKGNEMKKEELYRYLTL